MLLILCNDIHFDENVCASDYITFRLVVSRAITGPFRTDSYPISPLQWPHNGQDGVSNHQPNHCLLNRLFGRRSKKTSRSASLVFVWGIHQGTVNSLHKWPVTRKMYPIYHVIMHWGYSYIATAPTWQWVKYVQQIKFPFDEKSRDIVWF